MFAVDVLSAAICVIVSEYLVMGTIIDPVTTAYAAIGAAITMLTAAHYWGFYRSIIRYIGVDMLRSALWTAFSVSIVVGAIFYFGLGAEASGRLAFTMLSLQSVAILGGRFGARLFLNQRHREREAVVIYGAGEGGIRLAASLATSTRFAPVAHLDDKRSLANSRVNGLPVFPSNRLKEIVVSLDVKRVLLALPSASRQRRRQIIEYLAEFPVRVQTIPDIGDLVSGQARVDDIQDVSVEDLLGRDPVPPHQDLLARENRGKVVLVTGAGGSIGSELCRKLLEVHPRQLLLVERSEIALYTIERRLRKERAKSGIDVEIIAMLGCVQDETRMLEILQTFSVDTLYHAAAYKHVPIVEHNVLEGVANNVLGTIATARAAIEARVNTFVLVSTDKAVSPTNVMGASKRLAELVLQDLDRNAKTTFCMVRFGNVLASSGSVVPLFREQIRSGGPVTVTHPEIIRYFMTIPEAAQLVIQAGAMANGGDVFVLDMGKPVKIVDLASKMIQLMGKTVKSIENPGGEIEIAFTGLRPAEKLYEELLIGSDVTGTSHPRIMRANEQSMESVELQGVLQGIDAAIRDRDWKALRDILLRAVEGYSPTGEIEDHVYTRRLVSSGGSNKVMSLDQYRRPE
ncbi:MAG: nucleoside-diphosphate sugar epimerase/dehydratase [Pseudomonadota bacterium]